MGTNIIGLKYGGQNKRGQNEGAKIKSAKCFQTLKHNKY